MQSTEIAIRYELALPILSAVRHILGISNRAGKAEFERMQLRSG
jgi:hypothetical protein